ncbi:hypothetical protein GOV08_01405 [Candidatus Woesearchaeota archaeon]|nr:hypothetical protein [Candidatus Woesearchaeota archaeon]
MFIEDNILKMGGFFRSVSTATLCSLLSMFSILPQNSLAKDLAEIETNIFIIKDQQETAQLNPYPNITMKTKKWHEIDLYTVIVENTILKEYEIFNNGKIIRFSRNFFLGFYRNDKSIGIGLVYGDQEITKK